MYIAAIKPDETKRKKPEEEGGERERKKVFWENLSKESFQRQMNPIKRNDTIHGVCAAERGVTHWQ